MTNFDIKLAGLSMLVGHHEFSEQFNSEYEQLLEEIKKAPGDRQAMAARLRRLADH